MKLVSNWRAVLRHAWSVRLNIIAAVLSGLEIAIMLMDGYLPIPQGLFASLAFVTSVAANISRFVAQRTIPPKDEAQ